MLEILEERAQPLLAARQGEIEALKEKMCENCVWPYKTENQDEMDERCSNCSLEKLIDKTLEDVIKTGYAIGQVDAAVMLDRAFGARFRDDG